MLIIADYQSFFMLFLWPFSFVSIFLEWWGQPKLEIFCAICGMVALGELMLLFKQNRTAVTFAIA